MAEFREGVVRAVRYANALGVKQVNCLCGKAPAHASGSERYATLVANLRHAADCLEREGIRLLVEPINSYDIPGFVVNTSAEALALIDAAGSRNIWLQYDIYHAQRMEGEIAHTLVKLLPRVAHVQLADNPGRGEPGTGEINYAFLFRHLDRIGYDGWVGCEYKPTTSATEDSLLWLSTMVERREAALEH